MSMFDNLIAIPPSEVVHLLTLYRDDTSDKKIDLVNGEYRNFEGIPWVLPSVRLAALEIQNEGVIIPEYVFKDYGLFSKLATKLILGEHSAALSEERVSCVQTVSGTGALRLGAELLALLLGKSIYYYSNLTWQSQLGVFNKAGFKEARPYRYWCPHKRDVDFPGLIEDLKTAPEGAVVILHASAHNPTGIDPTKDQWKEIAVVMKERKLFPFFDCAFQGLAKDLEDDAWSVRYFAEQGFELFCAQSFSKNFGLYSERIGNFLAVTKTVNARDLLQGHMGSSIAAMYLVPGAFGNKIITRILSKPELTKQWKQDIETMRNRVSEARRQLREALESFQTPGDWSFLTKQVGISTLIGLNDAQVEYLAKQHHIYVRKGARANVSVITQSQIEYVAKAIRDTVIQIPN